LCVNRRSDQKDRSGDQHKKCKFLHFFLLIKLPPVGG
jgi:hypothetical protein